MMLFVVASALIALAQVDAVNVATSYSVVHHDQPAAQPRLLQKASHVYAPAAHVVTANHYSHAAAPHYA